MQTVWHEEASLQIDDPEILHEQVYCDGQGCVGYGTQCNVAMEDDDFNGKKGEGRFAKKKVRQSLHACC